MNKFVFFFAMLLAVSTLGMRIRQGPPMMTGTGERLQQAEPDCSLAGEREAKCNEAVADAKANGARVQQTDIDCTQAPDEAKCNELVANAGGARVQQDEIDCATLGEHEADCNTAKKNYQDAMTRIQQTPPTFKESRMQQTAPDCSTLTGDEQTLCNKIEGNRLQQTAPDCSTLTGDEQTLCKKFEAARMQQFKQSRMQLDCSDAPSEELRTECESLTKTE